MAFFGVCDFVPRCVGSSFDWGGVYGGLCVSVNASSAALRSNSVSSSW